MFHLQYFFLFFFAYFWIDYFLLYSYPLFISLEVTHSLCFNFIFKFSLEFLNASLIFHIRMLISTSILFLRTSFFCLFICVIVVNFKSIYTLNSAGHYYYCFTQSESFRFAFIITISMDLHSFLQQQPNIRDHFFLPEETPLILFNAGLLVKNFIVFSLPKILFLLPSV